MFLSLFSKCSNLCHNIDLFMKNNYPLIIKYQIANLGHVFLVLSHKSVDDKNDSESDNDNENDNDNNKIDHDATEIDS